MNFSNYTVRDLVFYSGLFGGIIVVSQWMAAQYQTPHIMNVICGGVAGLALGTMAQKTYDNMKSGTGKDDDFPKFDDQNR
ncbi:MAG: hypothetical protein O2820_04565 [Planctomycetota bacterium]|nr:hypothetical protein [Planctomycetota bacterium]MDA1248478.1 hypothetical protein [Planctomycetota bacterium]